MWRVFDLFTSGTGRDWSRDLKSLYDSLAMQGREAEQQVEKGRVAGTKPSLPMERYAGTYADSLLGNAVVTYENGTLRLRIGKGFDGPLEHWHYDTFRARWSDERTGSSFVTFTVDASGTASVLNVELGEMMPFERVKR